MEAVKEKRDCRGCEGRKEDAEGAEAFVLRQIRQA